MEQMDFQNVNFFFVYQQFVYDFFVGVEGGVYYNNDLFSLGMVIIFKWLVLMVCSIVKCFYCFFNMIINGVVLWVGCFVRLEVGVWICRSFMNYWMFWIQCVGVVSVDFCLWYQVQNGFICQWYNFVDFM